MSDISLVDESLIESLTSENAMYGFLINTMRNMPSFKKFQHWHDITPVKHDMHEYLTGMIDNMGVEIVDKDLNIPKTGRCIFIGNHPTGLLEVMVWLKTILGVRKDIKFLANHWFQIFPLAREHIISINPFEEEQDTKQNFRGLKEAARHLAKGGALMIMPAGEVAHWNRKTRSVEDPAWKKSVLSLARFKDTPVIPCHASGQNSALFNLAGLMHPRLRTMMLIREYVKKENSQIVLKTGKELTTQELNLFKRKASQLAYLRLSSEALNSPIFEKKDLQDAKPIIDVIDTALIEKEISQHQPVIQTESLSLYSIKGKELPYTLQEIGRLRETNYRLINEGSGSSCDIDKYDDEYYQVIAWDREHKVIQGALRLGMTKELRGRTYFQEAVKLKPGMKAILNESIDFGRFFVSHTAPKGSNILPLLLRTIITQMKAAQDYRYILGQVSIPSSYPKLAIDIIVRFLQKYCLDTEKASLLSPRTAYTLNRNYAEHIEDLILDLSRFPQLKQVLRHIYQNQYELPPLLRFYVQCNAQVLTFNHDKDFGCVDALMILDRYDLPKHFSF